MCITVNPWQRSTVPRARVYCLVLEIICTQELHLTTFTNALFATLGLLSNFTIWGWKWSRCLTFFFCYAMITSKSNGANPLTEFSTNIVWQTVLGDVAQWTSFLICSVTFRSACPRHWAVQRLQVITKVDTDCLCLVVPIEVRQIFHQRVREVCRRHCKDCSNNLQLYFTVFVTVYLGL